MSVVATKRSTSSIQYVDTANKIYRETAIILTRLSARYSRLLAEDIMHIAFSVFENAMKANNIYPSTEELMLERKKCLNEARSALNILDAQMAFCYDILMQNPQGAFKKDMSPSEAQNKISKMVENVGSLIANERVLLAAVVKANKVKGKSRTQPQ